MVKSTQFLGSSASVPDFLFPKPEAFYFSMMTNLFTKRWPVFLLVLLALWGAASWFSFRIENTKPGEWREKKFTYLPEGRLLKPMLMGHDQAFASLLWVEGVLYFADAYLEGKSYTWLGHILNTILKLDPKFTAVYERGAMMLPTDRESQLTSLQIYKKGMQQFPGNYKIRFYAAMSQLSVDSNYLAAAEYLKPILNDVSVPAYIRTLSTTILSRGGYHHEWLEFLLQEYLAETNPLQRTRIQNRIAHLLVKKSQLTEPDIARNLVGLLAEDPKLYPLVQRALVELLQGTLSQPSQKLLEVLKTTNNQPGKL